MNERYRYGYGEDFPNRDFPFSRQGAMTDRREDEAQGREVDLDEHPEHDDEDTEERLADRMREAHAADEPRASDPGATMPFQRVPPTSQRQQPAPPAREADADAAERATVEHDAAEHGTVEGETVERDHQGAPTLGADDPEARQPASPTRSDSIFDVGEVGEEEDEQAESSPAAAAPEPAPPPAQVPGRMSPATERPPIALGPPAPMQAGAGPAAAAPAAAAPTRASVAEAPVARAVAAQAAIARQGQAESRGSLLAAIDRDAIRSRFVDIQAGFVDEPRQAVQEAEGFVDELVHRLVEALETERAKLKAAIDGGSTEDLRLALRGYRAFVDRLLNLTM